MGKVFLFCLSGKVLFATLRTLWGTEDFNILTIKGRINYSWGKELKRH